ncbi:LOW QUALITY PROTEIN: hypothetical protein CIHG_06479 [Coccidioides immitis H538.4]|uniref:Uncharacterized protein n=1 Tax=Coccidioides immitis H538.4 TaxID=396776 RepID=A0A0J8RW46_COCIT|nr:LOW QUALITY PROTEIN: hypothetical protein CIHG_06479 [Coccidioides immitis H538.4]
MQPARGAFAAKQSAPVSYTPAFGFSTIPVSLTAVDFTQVPAAAAEPLQRVINTGDNDVSPDGTPSQFLLFRGLEPSVTEEILAKGVAKLYKPSSGSQSQGAAAAAKKGAKIASTTGDTNLGAREGSIRRILLVRDRRSNESWRYGFAEFATVETLFLARDEPC